MFSGLMNAAIFQMCTLPMYEELQDRSPRRFGGCLLVAFVFVLILFVGFPSLTLILYGPLVSSNMLKDLPNTVAGDLARFGMALAVIGCYPIYIKSMIAPLEHTEERATKRHESFALPSPSSSIAGSPLPSPIHSPILSASQPSSEVFSPLLEAPLLPESCVEIPSSTMATKAAAVRQGRDWYCMHWLRRKRWRTVKVKVLGVRTLVPARPSQIAKVLIVIITAIGASMAPKLGSISIFSGAVQVAALVGLGPGLAGIFLLGMDGVMWRMLMVLTIVFGLLMSAIGMRFTDNFVQELQCSWYVSKV